MKQHLTQNQMPAKLCILKLMLQNIYNSILAELDFKTPEECIKLERKRYTAFVFYVLRQV